MDKYKIDSYAVVNRDNKIITIGSSIECARLARKMNSSNQYREECKPYRAVHIKAVFIV